MKTKNPISHSYMLQHKRKTNKLLHFCNWCLSLGLSTMYTYPYSNSQLSISIQIIITLNEKKAHILTRLKKPQVFHRLDIASSLGDWQE